jgi:hypothetical protein
MAISKKGYKHILTLEDLPGEKWKDIPFLDGVCEISNYGRVKSLRRWVENKTKGGSWKKERILRMRIHEQIVSGGKRKNYLLSNIATYEGRKHHIQIGRIVYYLFVKKINLDDRTIFIGYKDGNPFNVHCDNLFLTSPANTITAAYKKKHRPRESFGNKAKPVIQYDKTGKKIAIYESVYHAAKITGLGEGAIVSQLNYGIGYTGGFIWQYEKDAKKREAITPSIRNKIANEIFNSKIITQYDLIGVKLKEYKNIKVAAKAVKCKISQIRSVILGKTQTAAGYYWQLGKGRGKVSVEHIEEGRRKWKERICRPVTQYSMQGEIIKHYKSIAEAASETGFLAMTIFCALKDGGSRTCKGFIWRYGKGEKRISVPERIKRKLYLEEIYKQPVAQYALTGKRIAVHKDLRIAAKKVNGQIHGLVACVLGKGQSFKGFCWRQIKN